MKIQLDPEGYQPPRAGLLLLQFAVALLFVIFLARFWYLQIHRGAEFARMAQENRLRHVRTFASRGDIFDANGVLLAENRAAFGLSLMREDCPDIPATLAQVSEWTNVPLERIETRYEQDKSKGSVFDPILLLTDIPFDQVARIEAELINWPGLEIVTHAKRHYPEGSAYAHILGYVAEANKEELKQDTGLALGDTVGRQGLERVLESRLRGKKGLERLDVDVLGRPLNRSIIESPEIGQMVYLTLNTEWQKAIVELMGDYSGTVVVMEADTGRLKAMVTLPSYDNNIFIGGLSQKDWDELRFNENFPLQNRAIQSVYPPGSVWKLLMSAMLLEQGVSPQATVFCPGSYTLGSHVFRCWKRGGHGTVNMMRSLTESCDVYYYVMGEKAGIDKIEVFAKASGFGKTTGIDLPHENPGLVPSRTWKKERMKESWQGGETLNVSIGQGHTLVTPLQMAVFIAGIVNGGTLYKPLLLADEPSAVTAMLPISPENCALVKNYMVQTATIGTARILSQGVTPEMGLTIGGKTGTAQVVKIRMVGDRRARNDEMERKMRDHAWIGAFVEKGDKHYVVVTMLEHGGGGSSAAGPVARDVIKLITGVK